MNIIDAFGQPTDIPMANGQLEHPDLEQISDEAWLRLKAQIEGRTAVEIDPSMYESTEYLRNYLKGAAAALDAQLVMPTRLVQAEADLLLMWAQYTAQMVRHLRKLNEEMAQVDEF